MFRTLRLTVMPLVFAGVAGCSHSPAPETSGTRMVAEAKRVSGVADAKGALADQWKQGDKMVAAGTREIADANRKAEKSGRDSEKYGKRAEQAKSDQQDAAASLANGQDKAEEGARMKAEAEQQFTFGPPPQS